MQKKGNVTQKVIDYIKSNIDDGTWKIGSRIPSELDICKILNVSRISVRSALQPFISMKILASYHGKGTYLLSDNLSVFGKSNYFINNIDEALESLQFRLMVEPNICRSIASTIDQKTINELEQYLKEMVDNVGGGETFVVADMKFHEVLSKATGNSILISIMDNVFIKKTSLKVEINNSIGYYGGLYYHPLIIDALVKHDGERAFKIMEDHIQNGINELKKKLSNQD